MNDMFAKLTKVSANHGGPSVTSAIPSRDSGSSGGGSGSSGGSTSGSGGGSKNPIDANPINQFFEVGPEVASAGPELVWKIHAARRRSDHRVSDRTRGTRQSPCCCLHTRRIACREKRGRACVKHSCTRWVQWMPGRQAQAQAGVRREMLHYVYLILTSCHVHVRVSHGQRLPFDCQSRKKSADEEEEEEGCKRSSAWLLFPHACLGGRLSD